VNVFFTPVSIRETLKALKRRSLKRSSFLALIALSGCYAPTKVEAPIYLCWLTDKASVCAPANKPLSETFKQLPPAKIKPWEQDG
jgi:hypothetical protein